MPGRSMIFVVTTLMLLSLVAAAAPPNVGAGGGCHGPVASPGDGEASVVKIDGCMYYPTVARVTIGTTVRFLNTGNIPHNVTGVSGTWASDLMEPGDEFRHTFFGPGVYPFACTLHGGMNGAIVVGGAVAEGGSDAAPAAPAVVAGSQADASANDGSATARSSTTDWASIVIAAVGGLVLGALLAALVIGMSGGQTRRTRVPTTD